MTTSKRLASASLAIVLLPALFAEPRCPGNAAGIRPRFTGRSLVAVPVMLDNTGPFDFVVDTGAEITTIDPRLAAELHPKPLGATHVTGVGTYSTAAYARLMSLQAATYSVKDPLVLVQDVSQVQQVDPRIRGILGENFLEHFDLLIDYVHRLLCLDDTKQMQAAVKGERVGLTAVPHADAYLPFTLPAVVSTRVSGIANRGLLLQLDSGINVPVLFDCGKQFPHVVFFGSPMNHKKDDAVVGTFAALQPQDIRVGNHALRQISFVTPVTGRKVVGEKADVDGVMPTALFRSVFISYADHFAILQP